MHLPLDRALSHALGDALTVEKFAPFTVEVPHHFAPPGVNIPSVISTRALVKGFLGIKGGCLDWLVSTNQMHYGLGDTIRVRSLIHCRGARKRPSGLLLTLGCLISYSEGVSGIPPRQLRRHHRHHLAGQQQAHL